MIDLRGCHPSEALKFVPDESPVRLAATKVGTDEWKAAQYELRCVAASDLTGVAVGDFVLFSRLEKDISVCSENPTVKG